MKYAILIAVILIVLSLGSGTWAAPSQNPYYQTVPTVTPIPPPVATIWPTPPEPPPPPEPPVWPEPTYPFKTFLPVIDIEH